MMESKRKVILGIVLGLTVILGLIVQPWKRPSHESDADSFGNEPATTPSGSDLAAATAHTAPVSLAGDWPDDPFRRPEERSAAPAAGTRSARPSPGVRLQGIMVIGSERVCVLDGQTYTAQATVRGWQIERIGDDDVVMTRGESRVRLTL